MNALAVLHFLSSHPYRDLATDAVVIAVLLAIGHYWPGWTEAKWRITTAALFLYGLPLWTWMHAVAAWGRFNTAIGRRP